MFIYIRNCIVYIYTEGSIVYIQKEVCTCRLPCACMHMQAPLCMYAHAGSLVHTAVMKPHKRVADNCYLLSTIVRVRMYFRRYNCFGLTRALYTHARTHTSYTHGHTIIFLCCWDILILCGHTPPLHLLS